MGPLSVNGSHPGPTSRKLIRLQRGDVVGSINIKSSIFVSSKLRNLGISGERLEKVVVDCPTKLCNLSISGERAS